MKTRVIIFTLLSTAFMCSFTLTTSNVRGAPYCPPGNFTCNAVRNGSTSWYFGEQDQKVTFDAVFTIPVITDTRFNFTFDNWVTQNITYPVTIDPLNNKHCYITATLNFTGGGWNQTWRFRISKMDSDPSFYTDEIVINVAKYGTGIDVYPGDPANATNMVVTARPAGAALITWQGGVRYYDDLGAWAPDNVELYHWEIYRSTSDINSKNNYHDPGAVLVTNTIAPTTFQYTDTPPSDNKYYYAVVAVDRAGHESEPPDWASTSIWVITDRVVPVLNTYKMNDTSYFDTNSHMNVPIGGIMHFKFTLSEVGLTGKLILATTYNNVPLRREFSVSFNSTESYYWVDVDTTPVGSEALRLGTYDVTLNFSDAAGNTMIKVYTGQISIYEPNPLLDALMWIIPIAAVALVMGYVANKKLKQRRIADLQRIDTKTGRRRKGEIYKGASDLGRASGDEAEEILAKRRREVLGTDSKRKERGKAPESRPIPSNASLLSDSTPISAAEIREKEEKFDTISASAGAKEIRAVEKAQTIDMGKKARFLEGRVTNLENVMSIAVNLVEMIPESPPCEKCGKPLNPSWSECPWCLTSAQSDELEMKMAISGIDGNKASVCPTCRAPLQPGWVKCPYCATRKV